MKLLPFPAFSFAAAGKSHGTLQFSPLAGPGRRAVVGKPAIDRANKDFIRRRITNAGCYRAAAFYHRNRNTKFWNALHELARPIQRIDNPHPLMLQPRKMVGAFFGKPAFTFTQQVFSKSDVESAIGFGDRVVSRFIFGLNFSGSEARENFPRGCESRFDSLKHAGIGRFFHLPRKWAGVHNILMPVVSRIAHRIRRSHNTGTRVLRLEPRIPPGIDPIRRYATREGSTLPNRKCRKLVTPVRMTACTMSVPTITFGG